MRNATSEQRCSTPTPTYRDAPNGAEPNPENGIEKGPNTQTTEEKKIPIEAMRDPPPSAKISRKTSIRMDFIKERPECHFQFRQCRNNECRICSDQKCSAM